jgi:hypothetical protein
VLTVSKLTVRSFNLDHLDVLWEIAQVQGPPLNGDLSDHEIYNYDFYVLRSDVAMGPYKQIGGPLRDKYHFRDAEVHLLRKWGQHFYKLKIVDRRDGSSEEFGPASSYEPEPDLIAAAIMYEEEVLWREMVGRKCWLFPARTFGPRCSCFDTTLGRTTRSNHLPCYGTGWLGGFMSPVEIFLQIDPSPKQTQLAPTGEWQPNVASGRMSSFPPVNPRDIIIETENRRWRVANVQQTQRLRAVVHQELQLQEIPRGDVEYALPLNLDATQVKPASERNFKNAQNIQDDGDYSDITSFWQGKPRGALR